MEMKKTEQNLIKTVGVMLWLNNAIDDLMTDKNLKSIIKQDLKMQLNRVSKKLEEQMKIFIGDADVGCHEEAQAIYSLIDDILIEEGNPNH